MDEIGENYFTDPSRPVRQVGQVRQVRQVRQVGFTPSKPSLREGLGGSYFKIILIRAVTSLTLISPSPLMSHTASE